MADAVAGYRSDPDEIYRESFAIIRREADLARFDGDAEAIAIRLIHACGMVDLVDDLVVSPGAVAAGREAIANHRPVLCDVEMVRHGIMRRLLPQDLPVLCRIGASETADRAAALGTTRAAAAMDRSRDDLAGGIVVIGNAPTALFHLLEMVESGCVPPALIIGIPVGFVGAVESKDALIAAGCAPFITVRGRRGGSAMAAAALNAVAGGLGR